MKVLKYENRKSSSTLFDISTPEKEAAGYLRLFKELDEDWQVYSDLEEDESVMCDACTEGQHKYCKGYSESCSCDATADCANHNHRAVYKRQCEAAQRELYTKAQAGDWKAAKRLMVARKSYEYEYVSELEVTDPLIPEDDPNE